MTATAKVGVQKRSSMDFLSAVKSEGRKTFFPSLDDITPDPKQPRTTFRELDGHVEEDKQKRLEELAKSIASNGLNHPIVVRQNPDQPGKWVIVAGERRWRAHLLNRELGLPNFDSIEALITNRHKPSEICVVQLAENIDREDLSDIEIASAMKQMLDDFPELQQRDLTDIMGRSKQWVSRMLGLMDPRFKELIDSGFITYAAILEHYKTLPAESQKRLARQAKESGGKITSGMIAKERSLTGGKKGATAIQANAVSQSLNKEGVKTAPASQSEMARSTTSTATAVQEVRMQLSQLKALLPVLNQDEPISASITLNVAGLRAAIRNLDANPVRDPAMLGMQLLELLNTQLRKKNTK